MSQPDEETNAAARGKVGREKISKREDCVMGPGPQDRHNCRLVYLHRTLPAPFPFAADQAAGQARRHDRQTGKQSGVMIMSRNTQSEKVDSFWSVPVFSIATNTSRKGGGHG